VPLLNDEVIDSVCAVLAPVSELAQAICVKPVQELVDEINCKNKFLSVEDAVMVTFNGPPVTEKVYHPSRLNVPVAQVPIVGPVCGLVAIERPAVSQGPFIAMDSAAAQLIPCALISFVNKRERNKVKIANQEWFLKSCRLAGFLLCSFAIENNLK
jgi:hypothetical protein